MLYSPTMTLVALAPVPFLDRRVRWLYTHDRPHPLQAAAPSRVGQ